MPEHLEKGFFDAVSARVELLYEVNPVFIYFVPDYITKSISGGFQR
jgi:hypothetical protein